MWPKAFSQLIELAPHVSRLLPLADRFFQNKGEDDGSRKAVEALAQGLRGDLGQVSAAHAKLGDQVNELTGTLAGSYASLEAQVDGLGSTVAALSATMGTLTGKLDSNAADIRGARLAAESVEARLTRIEGRQTRLFTLFAVVLFMLAAALLLLGMLVSRGR